MPDASADGRLNIWHLAGLANLPLTDEEAEELAEACSDVLEAFSLDEAGDEELVHQEQPTFEDEPTPWPEEGIKAILEQVPRREGRSIQS